MNVSATLVIALCLGLIGYLGAAALRAALGMRASGVEHSWWGQALCLCAAFFVPPGTLLTIGLRMLSLHLTRRAATPLPPPAPDPLATYREAPAECPRHPFAR